MTKIKRIRSLPRLPVRSRDAHKRDFGRILMLGGSRGMIGAPALAANAALRGGAGLVTIACPETIQLAVAGLCPCATTIPLPTTPDGLLNPRKSASLFRSIGIFDDPTAPSVVAAGPGLGRGNAAFDSAWFELLQCFGKADIPIVLDADGLNALHRASDQPDQGWDDALHFHTVITPHPGEMARLHGCTTAKIQQNRADFAVSTAMQMSQTVVVLKGANTLVTNGTHIFINNTGNPGMATGGSGDVLTGLIAALIGQGLSLFDSAVLGVHIHGLAGDLAARDLGEISLIATDIIHHLPAAFMSRSR